MPEEHTPEIVSESASWLDEITSQINQGHREIKTQLTKTLATAREVGAMLLEVKAAMKHSDGAWGAWLATRPLAFSDRTARVYMRIARNWDKVAVAKMAATANLTIQQALESLARPTAPPATTADAGDAKPEQPSLATALHDSLKRTNAISRSITKQSANADICRVALYVQQAGANLTVRERSAIIAEISAMEQARQRLAEWEAVLQDALDSGAPTEDAGPAVPAA